MMSNKKSYGPYVASGLLHIAILALAVWSSSLSEPPKRIHRPQFIEAKLLAVTPTTKKPMAAQKAPEKKPDPQKPIQPPPSKIIEKKQPDTAEIAKKQKEVEQAVKKAADEKVKQAVAEKAKQQAAADKAKQEQAKLKAVAEAKQQAAASAKKAADEKAKKEAADKAKKTAEDKAKAEKERLVKEAARKKTQEIQRQKELSMAQALADEESLLMAEQSDVVAQSYMAALADRVSRYWSRPLSARRDMVCLLRITLVPTGQVVDVSVVQSSGDGAFDRSAIQAVQKAEKFDLKGMPTDVFESHYRVFNFQFSPEDLRL